MIAMTVFNVVIQHQLKEQSREQVCIIDGAMDNFDKNDAKEGSHDTILMLFQNPSADESINVSVISTKDVSAE